MLIGGSYFPWCGLRGAGNGGRQPTFAGLDFDDFAETPQGNVRVIDGLWCPRLGLEPAARCEDIARLESIDLLTASDGDERFRGMDGVIVAVGFGACCCDPR